jgi:hypothetical protein
VHGFPHFGIVFFRDASYEVGGVGQGLMAKGGQQPLGSTGQGALCPLLSPMKIAERLIFDLGDFENKANLLRWTVRLREYWKFLGVRSLGTQ